AQTREVLQEIGAGNITCFMIYNKQDANPEFITPLNDSSPGFLISALNKTGLPAMQAELVAVAEKQIVRPKKH
ncbi:MAG: hypothetical protein V3S17_02535, partial [candidate division Zixibacteria bacterium]